MSQAELPNPQTTEPIQSNGSSEDQPDLSPPELPVIFAQLESKVYATAISPYGRRVLVGLDDGSLQLFDLITGNPIGQPFKGHDRSVLSVAFAPDGQSIVSGSDDNTLRLWDLNGNPIGQPFKGHDSSVWSVAFASDGQSIVSGSDDNTLRLWVSPTVTLGRSIRNLGERVSQIIVPQSVCNDASQGDDYLSIKDEIDALAQVLMLRALEPPVAVGMLGSWGSGKSFGMYLIQNKINEIRSQRVTKLQAWGDHINPSVAAPFVGHIYQIQFNAWTYAKSNLWASLMQEIFYELNRQIGLEQQLAQLLSHTPLDAEIFNKTSAQSKRRPKFTGQYIDQFIKKPVSSLNQQFNRLITYIGRPILFLIKIVDLCLIQFLWHIILLLLTGILLLFILIALGLDFITQKRFEILDSKLSDALTPFITWLHLEDQLESYYFPDLDINSQPEAILEHILFFLLVGFPTRLQEQQKFWQTQFQKLQSDRQSDSKSAKDFQTRSFSKPKLDTIATKKAAQTLREGGEFWKVLYLMSDEERSAFLNQNLDSPRFQQWQRQNLTSQTSNDLWHALEQIKQVEQTALKAAEQELQTKEKELQRKLKSAETGVDQRLSRQIGSTLWKPLIHGLARLRFSSEDIENMAASDKTFKMLRQTINSWQGLLALFLMSIFIVFTTRPDGWAEAFGPVRQFLEQYAPIKQLLQKVPSWTTTAIDWFKTNLPIWFQISSATLVALVPTLKALGEYISSVQKEQARIQSERESLIEKEKQKATELIDEVAQLKLQVEEKRRHIGLTASYSNLTDFINARLDQANYSEHLGMMQLVKQDLAALSERLTVNLHNQAELKKFFPRGPARVILYIDDLDRCPPDRVVEVLEAVQLLLKTKLFIVVLAIDDRYIARALEQVYKGVLKRKGKPSGIDYLEKIIQIPYRMRPISPAKVEDYLHSQVIITQPKPDADSSASSKSKTSEPKPPKPKTPSARHSSPPPKAEKSTLSPDHSSSQPTVDSVEPDPPPTTEQAPGPTIPIQQTDQTDDIPLMQQTFDSTPTPDPEPEPITPSSQPNDSRPYLETVASITEFDADEFQILVDCCKQVDITPRTAKRLINIYKILQIIWSKHQQQSKSVPDRPRKQIVLSFLTLSGRYPSFMRSLFAEIDTQLEEKAFEESPDSNSDNPVLAIDLDTLLEAVLDEFPQIDAHAKREWRRFDKDIHRMLHQPTTAASKQSHHNHKDSIKKPASTNQPTLDRQTFELILSFCFIGDIGYDPDDNRQP